MAKIGNRNGGKGRDEVGGSGVLGQLIGDGDDGLGDPKWLTLERKEVRFRADQLTELADLRRQVNARRRDRSEIITDNTLVRVAVDLLLKRYAERLRGDTEEDLLRSVMPRRRDAQEEADS
ncbi:hypothetical protein [Streptomyces tsukubensis]|uniref:hypothetical protein n=1 Tax=Streptomyces tsukubensis TaxID=83656 RepID=UPI00344B845E